MHWQLRRPANMRRCSMPPLRCGRSKSGWQSISCLLFGVSVCLYSGALWQAPQRPAWLPLLGLASGLPTATAGAAMAYDGFSERVMLINMPANLLLPAWMLGLAWHAWHRPLARV